MNGFLPVILLHSTTVIVTDIFFFLWFLQNKTTDKYITHNQNVGVINNVKYISCELILEIMIVNPSLKIKHLMTLTDTILM